MLSAQKMTKPLIYSDDNLIAESSWSEKGYVVASVFEKDDEFEELIQLFTKIAVENAQQINEKWPENTALDHYHHILNNDEKHSAYINALGYFISASKLGEFKKKLELRVSELCGSPVHAKHPDFDEEAFSLRIVRPGKGDNNPMHRDVWLDRLRNGINIYLPIAGSTDKSSLRLIEGSHLWSDDEVVRTEEGAVINGVKYTVPQVLEIKRDAEIIRPNPGFNEMLVFSPYLLHGGASNHNEDRTRISLEMRFWRK